MKFSKFSVLFLSASIILAPMAAAGAEQYASANGPLSVSDDAAVRIVAAMEEPLQASPNRQDGDTAKRRIKPEPFALIAFGVTMLAAPVSLGGGFSR